MKNINLPALIILGKKNFLFTITMVLIALTYNFISPNGIPLITQQQVIYIGEQQHHIPIFQTGKKDHAAHETRLSVKNIDYDETLALFHEPEPVFLDARSPEDYQAGHIPGALNIPVSTLESYEIDLMSFPTGQAFVCYCSDPACDLALRLTIWLEEHGFTNIYHYHAGWQQWVEKGGQISTGERP